MPPRKPPTPAEIGEAFNAAHGKTLDNGGVRAEIAESWVKSHFRTTRSNARDWLYAFVSENPEFLFIRVENGLALFYLDTSRPEDRADHAHIWRSLQDLFSAPDLDLYIRLTGLASGPQKTGSGTFSGVYRRQLWQQWFDDNRAKALLARTERLQREQAEKNEFHNTHGQATELLLGLLVAAGIDPDPLAKRNSDNHSRLSRNEFRRDDEPWEVELKLTSPHSASHPTPCAPNSADSSSPKPAGSSTAPTSPAARSRACAPR